MARPTRVFFQKQKLVVTVLPPKSLPRICPSDTCCGPPSDACRISMLVLDDLGDVELRDLIRDLRTKLNAEQRGIEIMIASPSEVEYSKTTTALKSELGEPVDKPRY
jgi:hypothetical protein